jgi:hypothetical protein
LNFGTPRWKRDASILSGRHATMSIPSRHGDGVDGGINPQRGIFSRHESMLRSPPQPPPASSSSSLSWPHAHARTLLFALNAMRENGGVGCDVRLRIVGSPDTPGLNMTMGLSSSDSAGSSFSLHEHGAGTLAAASSERHCQTRTPPHLHVHSKTYMCAHSVVLAAASAPFRRALEKSAAWSARLYSNATPQSSSSSLTMGITNLHVNRLSDAERRAFPQFLDALYGAPLPPPLALAASANDVDGARFISVFQSSFRTSTALFIEHIFIPIFRSCGIKPCLVLDINSSPASGSA